MVGKITEQLVKIPGGIKDESIKQEEKRERERGREEEREKAKRQRAEENERRIKEKCDGIDNLEWKTTEDFKDYFRNKLNEYGIKSYIEELLDSLNEIKEKIGDKCIKQIDKDAERQATNQASPYGCDWYAYFMENLVKKIESGIVFKYGKLQAPPRNFEVKIIKVYNMHNDQGYYPSGRYSYPEFKTIVTFKVDKKTLWEKEFHHDWSSCNGILQKGMLSEYVMTKLQEQSS